LRHPRLYQSCSAEEEEEEEEEEVYSEMNYTVFLHPEGRAVVIYNRLKMLVPQKLVRILSQFT
jgi:hypothetical protein